MTLTAGQKLGPYEVAEPIGAGGMGEVYRARDTRLDRIVAIKVLPARFADSTQVRQRFEREARAISSLNHPHICSLYDVGEHDGIHFLVMEYLEGQTLAQRLEKGPLPLDDLLKYAMQIADALDKAHRQGLVHRDFKPGNIMLTPQGAKLMDFGLAKVTVGAASLSSLTAPANATSPLTTEGTIVGTFFFMSPEQVEGKEVDARSDLFAFGAVLYEMLTGRRAFPGKSQLSVASAILEKEPEPVTALQPATPPALDRTIRKCLAKDPDDRWQTARDLLHELKWISEAGSQAGVPAPVVARRKSRERMWMASAAVLLLVTLGLLFAVFSYQRAASNVRPLRVYILPPEGAGFGPTGSSGGPVVVSPDGKSLAFAATNSDGKRMLYVRPLESLTAQLLSGTEDASLPFWSPDGRSLGFFAQNKLKKIEVAGGPPVLLTDVGATGGRGGTWSRDGVIVYSPNTTSGLFRISSAGGEATQVTKLDSVGTKIGTHRWPYFLPDGKHLLFVARGVGTGGAPTVNGNEGICVASLDGTTSKLLVPTVSSMVYASGHLLFVRDGTLMAQPFDIKRLEMTGEAYPIADHVQFDLGFSLAPISASENGVLTYHAGDQRQSYSKLLWFDRAGKELSVLGDPVVYYEFRISPDGQRVAVNLFDVASRNIDLWIYDVSRGLRTRFTFDPAYDRAPVWSPDSRQVAFNSIRNGQYDLYVKPSSGAGADELILTTGMNLWPTDWSPDGRFLMYESQGDPKTATDLWVVPMIGERKPVVFMQTPFNEVQARFSPDGKWVAYVSNESGINQVYVAPFPGPGGKWQISTAGGERPAWRQDGREIVYIAADDKLMSAEVAAKGSQFEVSAVKQLFQARPQRPGWVFDAARNTQRFLVNSTWAEKSTTPVTLVLHWTADLKK